MAEGFVGIDIGTHSSCVALYRNEKHEVVANENGNRTTPSVVAYLPTGEVIAGEEAHNQIARNTMNTIYDAKKILGMKFSGQTVQNEIKNLPFQIRARKDDTPAYVVSHDGKEKEATPEEITSHIVAKMREIAEAGLGKRVTKAVFAVPAHFTTEQRTALRNSAIRAGITTQRILTEPIAVVIAHLDQEAADLDKKHTRNLLVFDLGGGGLDVAVVCVHHQLMQLVAHARDSNLGGEAFDEVLVKHFETDFTRKFRGRDLRTNKRALARLRVAAERVKKNLSTMGQANVELDGLFDGLDFNSNLTRARFEDLVYDLTKACTTPITKVLEEANLKKTDIHDVLMVGGGSRILAVQNVVSQFFEGKQLVKYTNPEECVAMGACIEAEVLEGEPAKTDLPHPAPAAPHSLGLELADGTMGILIAKNSIVPIRKKIECSTSQDNQSAVFLQVYEGEDPIAKNNTLLGRFAIAGIPPAPAGTPKVTVTFTVTADGILEVVAESQAGGKTEKLVVKHK